MKAFTFANKEARSKQYHNLEDGEALHLESRISGVRRTNTGFLAAMDNDYAFDESSTHAEYVEKPDPDIQQSVQSLSRCTAAASFGLSFELEILSFLPRRSTKPIRSGVNGEIRRGTLWAIMDASGAGEFNLCECIELAAAPMALFLDEPIAGLDATSASSIIMTLKALSRLGIIAICISTNLGMRASMRLTAYCS